MGYETCGKSGHRHNILILLDKTCGKIGQLNNIYGKSGHKLVNSQFIWEQ